MSEEVSAAKKAPTPFDIKEVPYVGGEYKGEAIPGFMACAWMVLSYFRPEYASKDGEDLKKYMDSFYEESQSLLDLVAPEVKKAPRCLSAEAWVIISATLRKYLVKDGHVPSINTWVDLANNTGYGHWGVLENVLRYGPVCVKVSDLCGTGEGMVLALYVDADGEIIYHDPRGNALDGYSKGSSGKCVKYPKEFLTPHVGGGAIHMMMVTTKAL